MASNSSAYLPYVCSFLMPLYNFASWLELTTCKVSACVASWGLIASIQSVAFSFTSLLVLRAALGIGEAAFVGVPFFMSFFYKRDELAFRTGLFISAAPLATSFASSLAWVITKIGNRIPIADWRLLFLVEGFPSIVASVFVFLYIPDNPETARYLTRREQKVARLRLRKETTGKESKGEGLKWSEIWETLIDPKAYLTAVCMLPNLKTSHVLIGDQRQCSSAPMLLSAPCRSFYRQSLKRKHIKSLYSLSRPNSPTGWGTPP